MNYITDSKSYMILYFVKQKIFHLERFVKKENSAFETLYKSLDLVRELSYL